MRKLKDDEYKLMFQLLLRHSETEMDQWDQWKFESKFGRVYVTVSRSPNGEDDAWDDVTHILKT